MGRSEWGFLIRSNKDIETIKTLVANHNKESNFEKKGEDLEIYAIIQNPQGKYYICAGNGGGRDQTTDYIRSNYTGSFLIPFDKPTWWNKAKTMWRAKNQNDPIPNVFSKNIAKKSIPIRS